MTTDPRYVTGADAGRVQTKLQALYDGMPPEEQTVLETVLRLASEGGDVAGYANPCCPFHLTTDPIANAGISLVLPPMQLGAELSKGMDPASPKL